MWSTIVVEEQEWMPSKVICVGRNYVEHIRELNNNIPEELVLFIKPNSSLSSQLFFPAEKARFETEITFLMVEGEPVGVGVGLDITLIEVQKRLKSKGLPWEKSKAFDHSAVMSSFVPMPTSLDHLWLELHINNELRQKGGVAEMIHKPAAIFEEVGRHFSLENGDLIMTGTPHGVGDLVAGDVFEASLWDGETKLLSHRWEVERRGDGQQ